MTWRGYLLFGLLSLPVALLSTAFWMVNPVTALLMFLAAIPLRWFGYQPPVESWSGLGTAMWLGLLWPLTVAPFHWLNFRVLRWGKWGYAAVLLIGNLVIAMIYLIAKEGT
ncbi:MAG TPA: hypothetical protein VM940_07970 [Chthoniobacterales bacterium]|jgi:hypothetical protein|nr:hypothetical protein [Chthoniobacterales bacterium]